jgi:hypothetical protein
MAGATLGLGLGWPAANTIVVSDERRDAWRGSYSARYAATAWARKMPTLSNAIAPITNSIMDVLYTTNW